MTQKELQIEKKILREKTNLIFKRKNIFGFADSLNFVSEFLKLKQELEKMNYIMGKIFTSNKNVINFHFKSSKWLIFIDTKFSKDSDLVGLFAFLDKNFDRNGYTGTNEWKHDFCNILKTPMIGDLKYLVPEGKYWFKDEICKKTQETGEGFQ